MYEQKLTESNIREHHNERASQDKKDILAAKIGAIKLTDFDNITVNEKIARYGINSILSRMYMTNNFTVQEGRAMKIR